MTMDIQILAAKKGKVAGKLADVELHFTDGLLAGSQSGRVAPTATG
jgi:hypothetical protein